LTLVSGDFVHPCHFTPGIEHRSPLRRKLGGPHSRYERFGQKSGIILSGIRAPDRSSRSLVNAMRHSGLPFAWQTQRPFFFCVANKNNEDACLFLYLLQAIHLRETAHSCRILARKIKSISVPHLPRNHKFRHPFTRSLFHSYPNPQVFKIRLKVILPPTPCFPMSHPKKSPFLVP